MTRQDGGTRERLIRLALIIVVLGGALAVGRRASADPCPETYEFTADQLGTWLDFGSEGFLHDVRLSSDTKVTLQVQSCPNAEKPCGVCTLSGLIRNRFADAGDVLNQRCTNNPARACTNDGECGQQCLGGVSDGVACTTAGDCPGQSSPTVIPAGTCPAAGVCRYYFGSPMTTATGAGFNGCLVTEITGTVTGSVDPASGAFTTSWPMRQTIWAGTGTYQCPACDEADTGTNVNDGNANGACTDGARKGLPCDANGTFAFPQNGEPFTSLDCPPNGTIWGATNVTLPLQASPMTVTLSAAHKNCRDAGFNTKKCFCQTCQTAAAEPCATNADCPSGRICGGKRCVAGANLGNPCTTLGANTTDCGTGGFCAIPGFATRPNACVGEETAGVCTAQGNGDGACEEGPISQYCLAEPWRGCTSNAQCPASGDQCGVMLRPCYLDNGVVDTGSVTAAGSTTTPMNDTATVTLAGLYCAGYGTYPIYDLAGLPGLARVSVGGVLQGLPPTPTMTATPTATVTPTPTETVTPTPTQTPPVDPALVAPTLDRTVPTTLDAAASFLYTTTEIQTGVDENAIVAEHLAVVRGAVFDRDNEPLAGAKVTIVGHTEFGQTLTRLNGHFDMVVNGGGMLTVRFSKDGYLTADRQVDVPWRDFAVVPDVTLVEPGPRTNVDLSAGGMKVARGAVEEDAQAERRATILFPAGVTAQLEMPNGSFVALESSILEVSATEYTVGSTGPGAMPASLPPSSAFTYAVELRVEEAERRGARSIVFTPSVVLYLENFLDFPVGGTVPVGYYDRQTAKWIARDNGRIVKIVGVDGSNRALLDVNSTPGADGTTDLAALGITDDERATLVTLYDVGQSLWRVQTDHFSPHDPNWPARPRLSPVPVGTPAPAVPPDAPEPKRPEPDDQCLRPGSIIGTERQTLGEAVPLVGTPFQLIYQSDRVSGSPARLTIPISGATVPESLKRIELQVTVAGRVFTETFSATPSQTYDFEWDGTNVYGQLTQGRQPVVVRLGYVYDSLYQQPAAGNRSFALPGVTALTNPGRQELTLSREFRDYIGVQDATAQKMGGWTLDVHHAYNANAQVLYLGTGEQRSANRIDQTVLELVAGSGTSTANSISATTALLRNVSAVIAAPDGSIFLAESDFPRIRKIDTGGQITTVAGTGQCCTGYNGDGIQATSAGLQAPTGIARDSNGVLYIAESSHRIRSVGTDGVIHTIAGTGVGSFFGDGGLAVNARINAPSDVAVAPDGSVYIADEGNRRVRRIGPDGIITTVAGNGSFTTSGDGGLATDAGLPAPRGLAIGPDGSIYVAQSNNNNRRVRRIDPDGRIWTVAGSGTANFNGDGIPAVLAELSSPLGVATSPDGEVYIADGGFNLIGGRARRISPAGTISTVAGSGEVCVSPHPNRIPATSAALCFFTRMAVPPDGSLLLTDTGNGRLWRVRNTFPDFSFGDAIVVGPNADEAYVFINGRHDKTIDAKTGATLYNFDYENGLLTAVTDRYGNETAIVRDGTGQATHIVAPGGQTTTLGTRSDGFLTSISNPAGEFIGLDPSSTGLLGTLTSPRDYDYGFTYVNGKLTVDSDPAGGSTTLSRTETANGYIVSATSALSRVSEYEVVQAPSGANQRISRDPAQLAATTTLATDASRTTIYADGRQEDVILRPDPRLGMQAPFEAVRQLTLPSGLQLTRTVTRSATLASAADPFSVLTETETFDDNGRVSTREHGYSPSRTITDVSAESRSRVITLDADRRVVSDELDGIAAIVSSYDAQFPGSFDGTTQGEGTRARHHTVTYDEKRRVETISDPLARAVVFEYDDADRVTRTTLPGNRVVDFSYDDEGNLESVIPPGKPAHTFVYTPVNQLAQYQPPAVATPSVAVSTPTPYGALNTTYQFNADRQLDLITRPDGQTVDWSYHATNGRLTEIKTGELRYALSYYPSPLPTPRVGSPGKVSTIAIRDAETGTTAVPNTADLAFEYDGPLLTKTTWSWTPSLASGAPYLSRTFNNDLNVSATDVNGTSSIAQTYDDDGLLVTAGDVTLAREGAQGRVTQITMASSPVVEVRTYNEFGEVTSITAAAGSTPLLSLTYPEANRDKLGRIGTIEESVLGGSQITRTYTYNDAGQLETAARTGSSTATYEYDGNGNRTSGPGLSVDAEYDEQDRLLTYGDASYEYTTNGDLLGKTDSAGTTTYDYDVFDNLRGVVPPSGPSIEYVIDGANRRIGKKVGGVLVQAFVYDGQLRIAAELNGSGGVVSRFVYASRLNVPDYMVRDGEVYRLLSDHLGSVRLVVDAETGTSVIQRLEYDEFGRVVNETGTSGFQPFGFAGGLYDRDTGLVRFGGRDYNPEIGRWTSGDPILSAAGGTNLYAYVLGDPINLVDVDGFIPQSVVDAAAGFGDGISLGATSLVRDFLGTNGVVDQDSSAYWAGVATGLGVTAFGAAYGPELAIGRWRFAPWGNRTGNPYGEWPHYHRRGPLQPDGKPLPGQGIKRHRPWEPKRDDRNWCDRF